jgi:hypothetical protein
MKQLFEREMHLPSERRIWLQNPDREDFENAVRKVTELAKNGKKTLLFFHYSGHGFGGGGYVGVFGDRDFVNFTAVFSHYFKSYPNIWVFMAFDASLMPLMPSRDG